MSTERTVGVVGGGIVGLAIAREITRRRPGLRVEVFEKEDRLAAHQTGRNSGVVHAGIYYKPGSLKAELCTRGRQLLREYAAEHHLPYEECGKLVVAVDADELERLDALERTATANGVPGLRRLGGADIREVEPYAVGLAALHSPSTAITDFVAVAETLADEVRAAGGAVHLASEVTDVTREAGRIVVRRSGPAGRPHPEQRSVVDHLVLCGGLQSDRLARMAGANRADGADRSEGGPRIIPFRGEYMQVTEAKQDLVRAMVYPVPDPRYPFLGVHFTRRVSGALEVGPNAVLALHREGYRRRDVSWRDVRDIATWPGTWHLAREHWRTGAMEVRGSLSAAAYMRRAQRYVPAIGTADVVRGNAGVRAQAIERDGTLVDDFRISHADGVTSLRNAPSPAATSSLAIAEFVVSALPAGA